MNRFSEVYTEKTWQANTCLMQICIHALQLGPKKTTHIRLHLEICKVDMTQLFLCLWHYKYSKCPWNALSSFCVRQTEVEAYCNTPMFGQRLWTNLYRHCTVLCCWALVHFKWTRSHCVLGQIKDLLLDRLPKPVCLETDGCGFRVLIVILKSFRNSCSFIYYIQWGHDGWSLSIESLSISLTPSFSHLIHSLTNSKFLCTTRHAC